MTPCHPTPTIARRAWRPVRRWIRTHAAAVATVGCVSGGVAVWLSLPPLEVVSPPALNAPVPVPEPGGVLVLAAGLIGVWRVRR